MASEVLPLFVDAKMKHAKLTYKKIRRLTAPVRLRGSGYTHRHTPPAPWIAIWLLLIGMLQ